MKGMWLLLAAALYGGDVTGTWSGKVEITDPTSGETITTAVKAKFDQKDSGVSGRIGRARDRMLEEIRNGKVEGERLVFEVQPPEASVPMKFNLLLVNEDQIEGEVKGAIESGSILGKVTLSRTP
jgi:hypothetical protein